VAVVYLLENVATDAAARRPVRLYPAEARWFR
jgi:hypothetical protein